MTIIVKIINCNYGTLIFFIQHLNLIFISITRFKLKELKRLQHNQIVLKSLSVIFVSKVFKHPPNKLNTLIVVKLV